MRIEENPLDQDPRCSDEILNSRAIGFADSKQNNDSKLHLERISDLEEKVAKL